MTRTVSVVVPTFNRATCLAAAVDSALAQGVDIEVLIIDDGSTDVTPELVAERYGNDPRVRYIRQANKGAGAARNRGLLEAKGDFIAFLDSDDTWLPGKLAMQLRCLDAVPDAGMLWTDMVAVDANHQTLHNRYLRLMYQAYRWFPRSEDLFSRRQTVSHAGALIEVFSGEIFPQMILGNLVHTSTVLLRRERALRAGLFIENVRVGEDFDYYLRVCREGPVAFVDLVTIHYVVGAGDALTRPALELDMAKANIATLKKVLDRDKDRVTLPRRVIADTLAGVYQWAGRAALDADLPSEARAMYWAALRHKPAWNSIKFLGVSCLPGRLRRGLFSAVRSARKSGRQVTLAGLQVLALVANTLSVG